MKRYFVEGGLIFFSVLASFFIESYRLKQSNIEIKNGLLVELSQIINEDLKQINKVISIQMRSLDATNRLVNDYSNNQSMTEETIANNYLEIITNTPTSFYSQKGVYTQLLESGSLELIRYKTLRLKLLYVYEHLDERKLGIDRFVDDFIWNSNQKLVEDIVVLSSVDQVNKSLMYSERKISSYIINDNYYNSKSIIGFYAANINYIIFYIDVLKEYQEELNDILKLIDQELN
ncbi:MAG: hypothetical protein CMC04_02720 [Flavobacteriaceae bacterium]|jgi:hypothetical protein|nr:hypothetical protein [Flavobacteriaceae bacterium]|tara:strand:+ start:4471 stop:5169 length:699 start_codon:yes stop_codon:yes gene_type:complete